MKFLSKHLPWTEGTSNVIKAFHFFKHTSLKLWVFKIFWVRNHCSFFCPGSYVGLKTDSGSRIHMFNISNTKAYHWIWSQASSSHLQPCDLSFKIHFNVGLPFPSSASKPCIFQPKFCKCIFLTTLGDLYK